jgi:hypothetical protein
MPNPLFMFLIQICNVLKLNEIILCHVLARIHMFPPNCFMFVIYLFGHVINLSLIEPICGPLMLVTCVEHNKTYKKWILGHTHHVQMTH